MGILCVRVVICLLNVARVARLSYRIGIYAGAFNPVHAGHIAFALQALERANLDEVYFLPERKPRDKVGVEHFGHRVAMINRAVKPHPKFYVLELNDISLTVKRTIPEIQKRFPNALIVILVGSDVVASIPVWPDSTKLLKDCEIVVGVRNNETVEEIEKQIDSWKVPPRTAYVFKSYAPHVSSSKIRNALRENTLAEGGLTSVKRYSDKNWLYVSVS